MTLCDRGYEQHATKDVHTYCPAGKLRSDVSALRREARLRALDRPLPT
ncbi:Hypothetical protein A7982_10959 [Minicystis rosea]|nr:Hypothetical protein A7982_10959 [Minicystis rosea]